MQPGLCFWRHFPQFLSTNSRFISLHCLQITWLDGASLAQTLFTNLYLHDPNLVKDEYIKCFSVAILKITDWMRNKILVADCYEEVNSSKLKFITRIWLKSSCRTNIHPSKGEAPFQGWMENEGDSYTGE